MEKEEFVAIAPEYYALAIYIFLRNNLSEAHSPHEIEEYYLLPSDSNDPDDRISLLEKWLLFQKAVEWLLEHQAITVVTDPFAPPIYQFVGTNWNVEPLADCYADQNSVFFRFHRAGGKTDWLQRALRSLNETYDDLQITSSDFEKRDIEWDPLPLERGNPRLEEALEKLATVIEAVRGDNGYAVSHPGERDLVIDSLVDGHRKLETAELVTAPYLRSRVIDPLNRLIRRFGRAAIGVLAAGAKAAIIEFIKEQGAHLLARLSGLL
jgi:hypothetical protein